jgi:hypothetical protein
VSRIYREGSELFGGFFVFLGSLQFYIHDMNWRDSGLRRVIGHGLQSARSLETIVITAFCCLVLHDLRRRFSFVSFV